MTLPPLPALLALVALADLLFWGHAPGLSLAVFALALFAASLRSAPRPLALAALVLAVLPVIDHVQALSLAILALGLLSSLCLQARPEAPLLPATLSLLAQIPSRAPRDLARQAGRLGCATPARTLRDLARGWALPVGGLLILLSLLSAANPVLEHWLARLADWRLEPGPWLRRALFWAGMALLAWPLVLADPRPAPPRQGPQRPRDWQRLGLNPASVTRALILFNAALALQSLMDARYLWAGTTPPGMTLASYAHRGAYPLLATALLAGAFALAARPFADRPGLRALLYLWLVQNILLTLSALYRLDLYIQSYGLTYLRIHAAIWMALVGIGLGITIWQVARNHSAAWLLRRCAVLGGATLYLCAFVNFADLIARTNLAMGKIDPLYLCQLGPTAAASVPRWAWSVEGEEYDLQSRGCTLSPPVTQGWRDWGFRNWRVLHNLGLQEGAP